MVGEWKCMRLGDVVTLQRGHDLPSQRRRPGNVPILGSFGVTGWHDQARASGPGVTVGRSGASVGVVSYTAVDYWPLNTALYVTDFHGNDERFAYYFLKHFDFRVFNSGSAQPSLNRNFVHPVLVSVPPLPEQRAIAHILGTLDDKIELNRRMSETLEAMARALFKSWFVDFDPVRAKAEGRDPGLPEPLADLFPARLVDSELGEVPEGWSVGYIGDLLDQVREPTNPMESPSATFRHFSLPAFDDGRSPANELGANIKSLKSRVSPDSILLSKLNPEIERVWLVDVAPEDRAVCSTEFLVLRPRDSFGRAYAYCLLRSPTFRNRIEGLVTGTSKSHQRAHAGAILDLPGLIPPKPTVAAFERVASPWLIRTLTSRRESGTLASLRDTLLPKLISGELRVKDAERFVEAAA
jgi:type I restriction enzyme, S subunit